MANRLPEPKVGYPSSDGKPMAETGIHVHTILMLHQALLDYFQARPDVYVASDMFWYHQDGNPKARVSPDVMVIPGVGNHFRRSFFGWEEPAGPALVFEMASKSTWKTDLTRKRTRYRKLGVPEYVIFDPEALYLPEPLMGYRLAGTRYVRIPLEADGSLPLSLGFRVRPEGYTLRLIDATTELPIPTQAELAEAERTRAEAERTRADAATAEAVAATAEAVAATAAAADAEARAAALAAEVERLKALLHKPGSANGGTP